MQLQNDVLDERHLKEYWFYITMVGTARPHTNIEPLVVEIQYSSKGVPQLDTATIRQVASQPLDPQNSILRRPTSSADSSSATIPQACVGSSGREREVA